ncbi:MAG TPA: hypothetical protein VNQ77_01080 [Frankiaceae bacterium]|nr:hypothetical protein [Frankiaceae bacterium]
MNVLRLTLATVAAGLALTTPASASSVCLDQPPAYTGCTIVYFEEGHNCITGSGTVAGQAYRLNPCR